MRRHPRPLAAAVVLAAALGAVLAAAGCSATPLEPVPGADGFAVVPVNGQQVLFAVDADLPTVAATAVLETGGIDPVASGMAGTGAGGGQVLGWTGSNEPTNFASVSPAGTDPRDLGISLDTGLSAVAGDRLASLLPAQRTAPPAALEVRGLDGGRAPVRASLAFVPSALDGDARRGFLAAAWTGGRLSLQVIGADGAASAAASMPLDGTGIAGVQWDDDGGATAFTTGPAPATRTLGGVAVHFSQVGRKTALADRGGSTVAYDDVRGSAPVVVAKRAGAAAVRLDIDAADPLLGIRVSDAGRVAVLQGNRIVVWDPATGEREDVDLPGTTSTVWQ